MSLTNCRIFPLFDIKDAKKVRNVSLVWQGWVPHKTSNPRIVEEVNSGKPPPAYLRNVENQYYQIEFIKKQHVPGHVCQPVDSHRRDSFELVHAP